jgi:putative peptide zinc metalloprotease protein
VRCWRGWHPIRAGIHPGFWYLVSAALLLGLLLVLQRWDAFTHTLPIIGVGVCSASALSLSFAVLHEFGHALTVTVTAVVCGDGVAFGNVPGAYTDTNEAWKLASRRRDRRADDWCWRCSPCCGNFADAAARRGVHAGDHYLAGYAGDQRPFMRFDGYFALRLAGILNLYSRVLLWSLLAASSVAGAGRTLTGSGVGGSQRSPCLPLPLGCIGWCCSWDCIGGLPLLFKALGIFLLLVELGWFIARCGANCVWWQRRTELRWNCITCRSVLLLLVALLWWWCRGGQAVACGDGAQEVSELYAPAEASQGVVQVWVQDGRQYRLASMPTLRSPELAGSGAG